MVVPYLSPTQIIKLSGEFDRERFPLAAAYLEMFESYLAMQRGTEEVIEWYETNLVGK